MSGGSTYYVNWVIKDNGEKGFDLDSDRNKLKDPVVLGRASFSPDAQSDGGTGCFTSIMK